MTVFSNGAFFLLLAFSVPLFHLMPREKRHHLLVAVGIIFYTWYAGLWVLLFFSELFISRFYRKGSRACWLGVIQALGVLVIFKYASFIEQSICSVFHLGEHHLLPVVGILPLAISFFTFEFVHFAIDSYKGRIPERNFTKYASFIFFFPTLVAGPIKRYQDFAPKVEKATFDWAQIEQGITRMLIGYFKKFIIADSLVEWTHMLTGEHLLSMRGLETWQSVFAYGFRIYFDFSGYSDIAIGCALLFGIVVPENFKNPYLKRNISEFWKSWHISLYRWLVDYVFIPLDGSRRGLWRTCRNILVVTGISGLWHGASWNFVLWGLYHGILLSVYHLIEKIWPLDAGSFSRIRRFGSTALTMCLVMFGWTFFALKTSDIPLALRTMFFLK